MHQLLDGVSFDGIFRPGEVYLFTESKSRGCHLDPLNFLYTIKSDSEIILALQLEIVSQREYFEFVEYLGWKAISSDCHVFRFLCKERPGMKEVVFPLYLHRMMNLQDAWRGHRKLELEE